MRERLLLFFVFTLTGVDATNCKSGSLLYPFGFSTNSPIKLACSNKTGQAQIGDFTVHQVTTTNIILNIPPLCKRNIHNIKQLFSQNFAPSNLQNLLLLQGCNKSSSSNCLLRRRFVEQQLNVSRCKSPVSCFDGDVTNIEDVVTRSGCKYWFSSITSC